MVIIPRPSHHDAIVHERRIERIDLRSAGGHGEQVSLTGRILRVARVEAEDGAGVDEGRGGEDELLG